MDLATGLGGLGGQIGEVPTRIIHLPNDAELPRFDPRVPFVLLDGAGSWSRPECLFCFKVHTSAGSHHASQLRQQGEPDPPQNGHHSSAMEGLQRGLGRLAFDGDWRIVGALSEARARGSKGSLVRMYVVVSRCGAPSKSESRCRHGTCIRWVPRLSHAKSPKESRPRSRPARLPSCSPLITRRDLSSFAVGFSLAVDSRSLGSFRDQACFLKHLQRG